MTHDTTTPPLADKAILVTGAAGGIGQATARVLARQGARVALVDLDGDALAPLAAELADASGRDAADFPTYGADVTDAAAVDSYMSDAVAKLGRLDGLFNNAGIEGDVAPVQDYDDEVFDRIQRVNVRGVWLNLKRAARFMLEQGDGGSIVNTGSGASLLGLPLMSAYVGSKHAVLGITRSAAVELAPSNIRVNAICPGPTATRMMESLEEGRAGVTGRTRADAHDEFTNPIPMGRYGEPGEMATTVAFLLSDAASFVTGIALPVDGARSAL
jgi:NAD(P)-dependent dehydrogenase (short-subunit alcohol dehydrogenase family)